ncbi:MAG: acyltransferase family protein [Bacteroidota bacterium]
MADTPSKRLASLDVFRGATVAGMMLVNNPGDWGQIYPPFKHAAWDGWTYTDTVFPFFLWIVGVAMTFSFAKRIERSDDKRKLALHVLRRSAIIFALGLLLNGFPFGLAFGHEFSWSTIRIPGVLQRIAVCYLFTGLIFLSTSFRQQISITAALLAVYWLAMKLVPVPGFGAGVLEPTGNLCWYIDSNLLAGHTWRGAPVPGFDPEGIFSTIPAIATMLFGVLTGHLLRSGKSPEEKTSLLFVYGSLLLFAGTTMNYWFPINKNLWTSSYVVFMAGMAMVVLGVCYWFIDAKGYRQWTKPFEIYGLNAITIFVLAGLFARTAGIIKVAGEDGTRIAFKTWYYQHLFIPLGDPMVVSFLHSLAYVVGLYIIAYGMYRMKWVIKA